jgi:hypothetical protein
MQITAVAGRVRERPRLDPAFLNWAIGWVLLPNLPFFAMWLVGGPPRVLEIFVTGIAGLIARRAPFWVQFPLFVALLTAALMSFVSALFSLSIKSMFYSLRFVVELSPSASVEYILLIALLLVTLVGAWKVLRRPQGFDKPMLIAGAGALLFGLCAVDLWAQSSTRGSYRAAPPADAPFSSGVRQSGFDALAGRGNHLVIVMVEAMGLPRDPALQAKLVQRWRQGDIARRYEVSTGSTPFWGSTTNGEMRELCGRWDNYHKLMDSADPNCLPARLARQGYRTTAIHGFKNEFFGRTAWYPNVGFQQLLFREDLVGPGVKSCGGVFPGACDSDVPALIGERLKGAEEKQFVYWLTLNSHIPVPASESLGTKDCARFDPDLARDHAMICRLFSLWADVDAQLATMLADPSLPPTDVLLVGDHAPPFFDRSQRSQFDPERVPWVLLKHKDAPRP